MVMMRDDLSCRYSVLIFFCISPCCCHLCRYLCVFVLLLLTWVCFHKVTMNLCLAILSGVELQKHSVWFLVWHYQVKYIVEIFIFDVWYLNIVM